MRGQIQPTKVSAQRARELLTYDASTGILRWRVRRGRSAKPGDVAGCVAPNGYRHIRIDGRLFQSARLVWLVVYGEDPRQQIDHINLDRLDDRLDNLRLATNSENQANQPRGRNNRSGFKGVSWFKPSKRWRAVIRANNRQIYIGLFDDPAEAHRAYVREANHHFGEFANAG